MSTETHSRRRLGCPHCNRERTRSYFDNGQERIRFFCGTVIGLYQSDLCRAYEGKKRAEADLLELWSRFDKQMQAEAEVERLKDAEAENQRLRDIANKAVELSLDLTTRRFHWYPPEARVRAEQLRDQLNLLTK